MHAPLKAQIVKIGNSSGVRIPKVWLDQLNLGSEVEMAIESGNIVIRSATHPRQNWDRQFKQMAQSGDDQFLDKPTRTSWEKDEWEW